MGGCAAPPQLTRGLLLHSMSECQPAGFPSPSARLPASTRCSRQLCAWLLLLCFLPLQVVFLDTDPEARAPFYYFLKRLGLATLVDKPLIEVGGSVAEAEAEAESGYVMWCGVVTTTLRNQGCWK